MGLNGPAKLRRLRDVTLKKIGSTVPRLARLDNVEQVFEDTLSRLGHTLWKTLRNTRSK